MQAFEPMQRSSTDFESTPAVLELMQSYFLKLLSRYREFVEPDYLQGGQDAGGIRSRNGAAGEDDSGYLKCDVSNVKPSCGSCNQRAAALRVCNLSTRAQC